MGEQNIPLKIYIADIEYNQLENGIYKLNYKIPVKKFKILKNDFESKKVYFETEEISEELVETDIDTYNNIIISLYNIVEDGEITDETIEE